MRPNYRLLYEMPIYSLVSSRPNERAMLLSHVMYDFKVTAPKMYKGHIHF